MFLFTEFSDRHSSPGAGVRRARSEHQRTCRPRRQIRLSRRAPGQLQGTDPIYISLIRFEFYIR